MNRLAFMFPGQGLSRRELARALDTHGGHALVQSLKKRLTGVVSRSDWGELPMSDTRVAQPSVFVASLLNARNESLDEGASVVLGHSFGEITALAYAGAIADEDGLEIAHRRGAICHEMQSRRPGAMVAIVRLRIDQIERVRENVLDASELTLEVAVRNGPTHFVLSGDRIAVEEASRHAASAGGGVVPLDIGGAFHSSLMADALPSFEQTLAAIPVRDPEIPVVSCLTAEPHRDGETLRRLLLEGLVAPVRWSDAMATLPRLGIDVAIDVGPGEVLYKVGRRLGVECRRFVPRETSRH